METPDADVERLFCALVALRIGTFNGFSPRQGDTPLALAIADSLGLVGAELEAGLQLDPADLDGVRKDQMVKLMKQVGISGDDVKTLYVGLVQQRSTDYAHRVCKWLRYLFSRAVQAKVIAVNPMTTLRLARAPARQVYWLEAEVAAAIRLCHDLDKPSIALAIRLAFDLGQRPIDIRAMQCEQWDGTEVVITQSKTGATVRIPALPELVDEVATAQMLAADQGRPWTGHIVRTEVAGSGYTEYYLAHEMREVIDGGGWTGKRFADLRRSSVVRLAQAGCTIPEIAAITGHSYQRCEQILQTYLPRTTPLARAAIQRIVDKRGMGGESSVDSQR